MEITLKSLQNLGFESIVISKRRGSSLSDSIIDNATGLDIQSGIVTNGTFIHKTKKLLVALYKDDRGTSTITFGISDRWEHYWDSASEQAEWLLSINRFFSDDNVIEEIFKWMIQKYGK